MSTEPVGAPLALMLTGCATCRAWAEQDEGPYHCDAQSVRRDIVEGREGVPLQLGIRLAGDVLTAVRDATVEVWQCDALGRYSGFPPPNDSTVVTAGNAPRSEYLPDQTFLRGRQRSDRASICLVLPSDAALMSGPSPPLTPPPSRNLRRRTSRDRGHRQPRQPRRRPPVRRALPRRTRRTVGAWCFVDHIGPATVDERGLGVAPHPHIGLQTVTWLLAGQAMHH